MSLTQLLSIQTQLRLLRVPHQLKQIKPSSPSKKLPRLFPIHENKSNFEFHYRQSDSQAENRFKSMSAKVSLIKPSLPKDQLKEPKTPAQSKKRFERQTSLGLFLTFEQQALKTHPSKTVRMSERQEDQTHIPSFLKRVEMPEDPKLLREEYCPRFLKKAQSAQDLSNIPKESTTNKYQQYTKRLFQHYSKVSAFPPLSKGLEISNFVKLKFLGEGQYGKVYLAADKRSKMLVALKIYQKKKVIEQGNIEQVIRQIKVSAYVDHPNVVKCYGWFSDADCIYIISEPVLDGQLKTLLDSSKKCTQAVTSTYIKQACQALSYLHSEHIIHRDIKPENIILHNGVAKICDFGWSVHHSQKLRTTFCGTPLYVSPEILIGVEYDDKIDVWSLGIVAFELLYGFSPFHITSEREIVKIVHESFQFPSNIQVGPEAKDFITKCLFKNPKDRPTAAKLLQHGFLSAKTEKAKPLPEPKTTINSDRAQIKKRL